MKKSFVLLYLLFVSLYDFGQVGVFPSRRPRLIVEIVIDNFRYDFISRYYEKLSKNGFLRLVEEGAYCKNAYVGYAHTQVLPGYATIATGTEPSVHGIVSNSWYNPLKKNKVEACYDASITPLSKDGSEMKYKVSPKHLFSSTFTDELKLFYGSKSKVYSVALDPSSSVLLGGHLADGSFFYEDETGNFISNSYYMQKLPDWVRKFNKKQLAFNYLNRKWEPLYDLDEYKESDGDSAKYEKGFGYGTVFPYNLMEIAKLDSKHPNYSVLKYTPFGNTYVHDFAIYTIVNESLGKDRFTDFLGIGFNSLGYIAKYYGTMSVEFEDAFLRLDKEIAHFLDFLDSEIGKGNVLVIVVGSNGVMDPPEYLIKRGVVAGRFKQMLAVSLLKTYLNALYGEGNWILGYDNLQFYLNRNLIEDRKLDLREIQQKSADFLMQFNGIALSVAAENLKRTSYSSGIIKKLQNTYHPKRSGDVFLVLQPYFTEDVSDVSYSNSPYSYDTRVPLFFYGWKSKIRRISDPVNIDQIAPTLSYLLEIMYPSGSVNKVFTKFYK